MWFKNKTISANSSLPGDHSSGVSPGIQTMISDDVLTLSGSVGIDIMSELDNPIRFDLDRSIDTTLRQHPPNNDLSKKDQARVLYSHFIDDFLATKRRLYSTDYVIS